jgi:hypothetical protein
MRIVIGFGRPATRLTDAHFNIITISRSSCRRYLRTLPSLVPVYKTVNLYTGECRLHWLGLRTSLLPDPMMSHIMLTLLTLDRTAYVARSLDSVMCFKRRNSFAICHSTFGINIRSTRQSDLKSHNNNKYFKVQIFHLLKNNLFKLKQFTKFQMGVKRPFAKLLRDTSYLAMAY